MKTKVKITVDEFVKIHTIEQEVKKLSLFEKVSTFLWGEKSFRWGELKGL